MLAKLKEEIAILRRKIVVEESSETGFMKYCRFGIPLLSNLSGFYRNASVQKTKAAWFDIPGKIAFSGRQLSNHPAESGARLYPTEKQRVRK